MGSKERRARSKQNLREEILEAARSLLVKEGYNSLFVKEGYNNVSIRKIADKIEYAPGTIYLYFKDKADILRTICDETFGKLHRKLSAIAEDSGSPLDKLRRAGRAYVQFALDNSSQYLLVFMTRLDESGSRSPMTSVTCASRISATLCSSALDQGLLRGTDVNETSQAIWAGVHGVSALLIAKCGFPFVEHSRLIERVIDMTVEGMRKPA